jgi:UDP-N-acetylmuramoylalanine--D-glutamate ligase
MINRLIDIFESYNSILILGFGREGKSTYRFIRKFLPEKEIAISDKNERIAFDPDLVEDKLVTIYTGTDYQKNLDQYDIIIKSPGVKLEIKEIHGKLSSQTDMFLEAFGDQVIGVTGTKGKSTTASMIEHILRSDGRSVHLIGNIGVPSFEIAESIVPNDIIVYELSAHQLEYSNHSPKIAVLLNIFPEHLDYFGTFEKYKDAKLNICSNSIVEWHVIAPSSLQKYLKCRAEVSFIDADILDDTVEIPVVGDHNRNNAEFAIKAVSFFGIQRKDAIGYLSNFSSLPHRLQYLGNFGGVNFINDSISTIPQSAIAAVKALRKVDILILGGMDRGLDYSKLIDFLKNSKIHTLIFLGNAGNRIYESFFDSNTSINKYLAKDLTEVFEIIRKVAELNDVCLLSPAAASYDQFRNFEHRGDMFQELAANFSKFDN